MPSGDAARRYYELWDGVSSQIQQAVAAIKTIQTHGTAAHEERRLREAASDAYAAYLERNRLPGPRLLLDEATANLDFRPRPRSRRRWKRSAADGPR